MTDHLPEPVIDALHTSWDVFKKHHPAGAYHPVGQLDGDCRECGGAWPCEPVQRVLAPLFASSEALVAEHRRRLASAWSAWLDLAMNTTLGTPDNPHESVLGTVLALNPGLRAQLQEALKL